MAKPSSEPATSDVLDPVCGKSVDPLRARAVGIFAGTTRYFCSQACKAKFADPRVASGAAPHGVERRQGVEEKREALGEKPMPTMPSSNSNEWFVKGEAASAATPVRGPDRFTDLEGAPPVSVGTAPSPSLLIEVQASRRGAMPWVWLVLAVLGGIVLALIGLR